MKSLDFSAFLVLLHRHSTVRPVVSRLVSTHLMADDASISATYVFACYHMWSFVV